MLPSYALPTAGMAWPRLQAVHDLHCGSCTVMLELVPHARTLSACLATQRAQWTQQADAGGFMHGDLRTMNFLVSGCRCSQL